MQKKPPLIKYSSFAEANVINPPLVDLTVVVEEIVVFLIPSQRPTETTTIKLNPAIKETKTRSVMINDKVLSISKLSNLN